MEDILFMFGGLMAVIAVQSLILIFIFWRTPAFTFLKAALLRKPLMYIIGKDRVGIFKTFKAESGSAQVGKDGLFHLTENSHTLEAGSKTPIYFAFRDLAATLLPEYPAIIQEIREKGIIINNIEDIKFYLEKVKRGTISDFPVSVNSYKTYKFHDLENMFPNNIDPTFIDATVQCEISKGLKMIKNGPMMLTGIVVLLVAAAVAVYIMQRAFTDKTLTVQECNSMINTVKTAASVGRSAVVQAINTSTLT
jgi:hypothetical protein